MTWRTALFGEPKREKAVSAPEFEQVNICCMWAANFTVESDSGTGEYLVQFHRMEPASCTCKAYKFSGEYGHQTCKHIKKVLQYGCFAFPPLYKEIATPFEQWDRDSMFANGVTLMSITEEIAEDKCPGCGLGTTSVIIKKEAHDPVDPAGS